MKTKHNVITIGSSNWGEAVYNYSVKDNLRLHLHIELPESGLADYCFILNSLYNTGWLDGISKIVIQHVREPKVVLYEQDQFLEKFIHYKLVSYLMSEQALINDTTFKLLSLKEFNEESFNTPIRNLTDLGLSFRQVQRSTSMQSLVKMSHEKIHSIASEKNIELYEFILPGLKSRLGIKSILSSNENGVMMDEDVIKFLKEQDYFNV